MKCSIFLFSHPLAIKVHDGTIIRALHVSIMCFLQLGLVEDKKRMSCVLYLCDIHALYFAIISTVYETDGNLM